MCYKIKPLLHSLLGFRLKSMRTSIISWVLKLTVGLQDFI